MNSLNLKTYHLVSSREPNGATWLINCLLALGIKTERVSKKPMWVFESKSKQYTISEHEQHLKRWLPILSQQQYFNFLPDIKVIWSHEFSRSTPEFEKTIIFIRDPRDSLYSRFKREKPGVEYRQFLESPDENTLKSKIETWNLFYSEWLEVKNSTVIRFEDYKKNAQATLQGILNFMHLTFLQEEINLAISQSEFQLAKNAEKIYLKNNQIIDPPKIRSSTAQEWQINLESRNSSHLITNASQYLLKLFKYQVGEIMIDNETSEFKKTVHSMTEIDLANMWLPKFKLLKTFPNNDKFARFKTYIENLNTYIDSNKNINLKLRLNIWLLLAKFLIQLNSKYMLLRHRIKIFLIYFTRNKLEKI